MYNQTPTIILYLSGNLPLLAPYLNVQSKINSVTPDASAFRENKFIEQGQTDTRKFPNRQILSIVTDVLRVENFCLWSALRGIANYRANLEKNAIRYAQYV